MEDENVKNVQVKQEYLIYGLAAALIAIVVLVGSLLYIISSQNTPAGSSTGTENLTVPPGHPPIREGAVPGPLDPSQVPQGEGSTDGQSQTPVPQTDTSPSGTETNKNK